MSHSRARFHVVITPTSSPAPMAYQRVDRHAVENDPAILMAWEPRVGGGTRHQQHTQYGCSIWRMPWTYSLAVWRVSGMSLLLSTPKETNALIGLMAFSSPRQVHPEPCRHLCSSAAGILHTAWSNVAHSLSPARLSLEVVWRYRACSSASPCTGGRYDIRRRQALQSQSRIRRDMRRSLSPSHSAARRGTTIFRKGSGGQSN